MLISGYIGYGWVYKGNYWTKKVETRKVGVGGGGGGVGGVGGHVTCQIRIIK